MSHVGICCRATRAISSTVAICPPEVEVHKCDLCLLALPQAWGQEFAIKGAVRRSCQALVKSVRDAR
jgi:hypothetical protein